MFSFGSNLPYISTHSRLSSTINQDITKYLLNNSVAPSLTNLTHTHYSDHLDPNHCIKDRLAKQQSCLHRAVKQLIEGKGDKIPIIHSTLIPDHPLLMKHNQYNNLNTPINNNHNHRAYLNPLHPFYALISAYLLFDRLAFNLYFADKKPSPYTQLLLMCDMLINIREQLECQQEANGAIRVNLLALQDIHWLLDALKINSRSPEFKKALSQYNHDTGYTDNFRTYSQYITHLFNKYSRLLIIRVDLGYQQQHITGYDTFRTDIDYFIKLIPSNPVFKDLIGYIWKLEYGTDKGYHAHLLLCYDGSKRRSDYHMAKQIGELWQYHITLGRGLYFNCNTKEQKESYKHCYLGMVHRSETDKINWMVEYGVSYLLKTDEYLRLMKPDNRRILGRGVMKIKNK